MASRASLDHPSPSTCPSQAAWMFGNGDVQSFVLTPSSFCCWRAGPGRSGHHHPFYRPRQKWCLWPPQNLPVWSGLSPKSQNGADDVAPAHSRVGPGKLWRWDGAVPQIQCSCGSKCPSGAAGGLLPELTQGVSQQCTRVKRISYHHTCMWNVWRKSKMYW